MKKHTPTPWEVIEEAMIAIKGADGSFVVSEMTEKLNMENLCAYDNAAFICQAVNAHEELLEAAKIALDHLGKLPGSAQVGINPKACDLLQRAIAKAEER